jgi:CDP-glycerol glycerophosphotransferase (TagB/SpsB family)
MTEEVIELTPFAFDSYELRDYFRELREILDALPAAQAIIKFRSKKVADRYEDYIIETLPAGRFVISYSDAFSMILLADIVCSPFSTMIYEGLLGKKPVVLYPVKKTDTYCRSEYEKGALPVSSPDELVKSIGTLIEDEGAYAAAVQKGQHFLENNYSFDGQASERLADILRKNLPAEAA